MTAEKELTLEFQDIRMVEEHHCRLFPVVYVMLGISTNNLELGVKTVISDSQQRSGLTLDRVREVIGAVIDINEWELERDAVCRWHELYGYHVLGKFNISMKTA